MFLIWMKSLSVKDNWFQSIKKGTFSMYIQYVVNVNKVRLYMLPWLSLIIQKVIWRHTVHTLTNTRPTQNMVKSGEIKENYLWKKWPENKTRPCQIISKICYDLQCERKAFSNRPTNVIKVMNTYNYTVRKQSHVYLHTVR